MTNVDCLCWGFIIGCVVTGASSAFARYIYFRILASKATDRTVEFINGKPYFIVPEAEYLHMKRHERYWSIMDDDGK